MIPQTIFSIFLSFVILSTGCEELTIPLDTVEAESAPPSSDTLSDSGQSTEQETVDCEKLLRDLKGCLKLYDCNHNRECEEDCWRSVCDYVKDEDDWPDKDCEDTIHDCLR